MTDFSAESTKMQVSGSTWQTCNLFWRTICQSTDAASGHKNVTRVEAYRKQYQTNIEKLLNDEIVSTASFTSYVNSFPIHIAAILMERGLAHFLSNYLQLKITRF